MRLRVVGLDRQRLAESFERLLVAAKRRQRGAAIVVRVGEFRFLLDRRVEALDRFGVAVERVQDEAVIQKDLRRGLAPAHRRGDELQGLGRLAFGELDQRHHLQRVDVIGPCAQDFSVQPLGLGQPALLVALQGLRQQFRDVRGNFGERLRHLGPCPRGRKLRLSRPARLYELPFSAAATNFSANPFMQ